MYFNVYVYLTIVLSSDLPSDVSAHQDIISLQVGDSSGFSPLLDKTPIEITFKLNKEVSHLNIALSICLHANFSSLLLITIDLFKCP